MRLYDAVGYAAATLWALSLLGLILITGGL